MVFPLLNIILQYVVGQQVLPHDIFCEIVVYISPYRMYVIRTVLSVVEFHHEISSVNSVVVFTATDPETGDIFVTDGYGNSRIHKYWLFDVH